MLVDGGYNGKPFEDFVKETLDAELEVAKRSELHTFAVIPKRWVVERSNAWLEKCRRLWKNCERKLETSLAFVRLAVIGMRRSGKTSLLWQCLSANDPSVPHWPSALAVST